MEQEDKKRKVEVQESRVAKTVEVKEESKKGSERMEKTGSEKEEKITEEHEKAKKRKTEGDESEEPDMKRRSWEDTGGGEALPSLPSGQDEEDRKRIREVGQGSEGENDSSSKRV